jgi:hypothetical protein
MFVFKTYAGIIRHSTFFDFFKIMFSSGSTLMTLLIINYCTEIFVGKAPYLYPNLFLLFYFCFCNVLLEWLQNSFLICLSIIKDFHIK